MLHIMCAALLGTVQVITLPPDIVPHGLALLANGTLFFATADATPLHRLDLSTGAISLLEASVERRKAWGLLSMEDLGLVALASGPGGELDLYDFSGAKVSTTYLPVHSDTLPTGQVAHVARLGDSLYLTNAVSNVLYRVLISDAAANAGHHHTIPITGPLNFDHTASLFFNAHGIVATPDQKALLVAASYQQRIFRVDPNTGDSMDVQLTDKDGKAPYLEYPYALAILGETLYVSDAIGNSIAVFSIDPMGTRGTLLEVLYDPSLNNPTSVIATYGADATASPAVLVSNSMLGWTSDKKPDHTTLEAIRGESFPAGTRTISVFGAVAEGTDTTEGTDPTETTDPTAGTNPTEETTDPMDSTTTPESTSITCPEGCAPDGAYRLRHQRRRLLFASFCPKGCVPMA